MSKLSTTVKLYIGFFVIAILVGIVGFLGLNGVSKISNALHDIGDENVLDIENLLTINKDLIKIRVVVQSLIISDLPQVQYEEQMNNYKIASDELNSVWKEYDGRNKSTKNELDRWNSFMTAFNDWKQKVDEYLKLSDEYYAARKFKGGNPDFTFTKMKNIAFVELDESFNKANQSILELVKFNKIETVNKVKEGYETTSSTKAFVITVTIIIFLVVILMGVLITIYLVKKPLKLLVEVFGKVSSSSKELLLVSEQTASASTELSSQSSTAASSSEQVSTNISTVSSASEEMAASVREIANNTNAASKITREATEKANSANDVMNRLDVSSTEIGNIVKAINSIAEQTNLLALNATIEAARAGELGKGFAVVANEVKELAKEAAKATEDITKRIKLIQTDSGNAVLAIKEIIDIMKQVNDITNTIASAVEEQTVTVNEISRNLSEATNGANSIAETNSGVAMAANDYAKLASQVKTLATNLEGLATTFETQLKKNF